jgi:hypothetical protein
MSITRAQISIFLKDQDQSLPEEEKLAALFSWLFDQDSTLTPEDAQRLLDDIHSYPEFTKGGNE